MAKSSQCDADFISVRDTQLRLLVSERLDEGKGQISGADTVEVAIVCGTGKDLGANAQLFDVPHALELRSIHHQLHL